MFYSQFNFESHPFKAQVEYRGADFHFKPPVFEKLLTKPSISVFGTAKRVGKTSVAGYIARLLDQSGYMPLVVTMGRGGPEEPEIVRGREISFSPSFLLEQAQQGKHACSDHWEDAYTSRVTTIGCRRCAGGMAGQVFVSNVSAGAKLSNRLPENFTILEGSGATFPPVQTDKKIVILSAEQPIEFIEQYFGPYRIGISDLAIVTGCEENLIPSEKLVRLKNALIKANPEIEIALTVLRPKPMGEIAGKKVLLVTTASAHTVGNILVPYLEKTYACKVISYSPHLSDRQKLRKDLEQVDLVDVVISEIKAAGVDVAASIALEKQKEVIFMDNIPVLVEGGTVSNLDEAILRTAMGAKKKFEVNA